MVSRTFVTYSTPQQLLTEVTVFYLNSREFNGLPIYVIRGTKEDIEAAICELIRRGELNVCLGDVFPNPHIQALEPESPEVQLDKFRRLSTEHACLYPSRAHLREIVHRQDYAGRPFTLNLALGEPRLIPHYFDLTVLEIYRNDPRYHYDVADSEGAISVKDKHYGSPGFREADQILMKSFGFGYSNDLNQRVVVAYQYYLHLLSPEHQQLWAAKEIRGNYFVHPDYKRTTFGHMPEGISIFQAFLEELSLTNQASAQIKRIPMFQCEYYGKDRPREFGFLIRPTVREYETFATTLDKMISENLDRKFFIDEIDEYREVKQSGDTVSMEQKGTISLLSEWLDSHVRFQDPEIKRKLVKTLQDIRKERSIAAHLITDNQFDMSLVVKQRDLMSRAYSAMMTLRKALQLCSLVDLEIPSWYQKVKVWKYRSSIAFRSSAVPFPPHFRC
ncbi:hypothetical protein C3F09_07275 [candidate division GN15 bacterium]|uniref:Uncharacterized protein n=1 Tax=candidate division GN15 bacterium TaxID=2072418 RepID=A0A855X2A3_9BACT|nr:MAG: hypothetical protein C3F09_07275 [candidate division GN15 bacterium]